MVLCAAFTDFVVFSLENDYKISEKMESYDLVFFIISFFFLENITPENICESYLYSSCS